MKNVTISDLIAICNNPDLFNAFSETVKAGIVHRIQEAVIHELGYKIPQAIDSSYSQDVPDADFDRDYSSQVSMSDEISAVEHLIR